MEITLKNKKKTKTQKKNKSQNLHNAILRGLQNIIDINWFKIYIVIDDSDVLTSILYPGCVYFWQENEMIIIQIIIAAYQNDYEIARSIYVLRFPYS